VGFAGVGDRNVAVAKAGDRRLRLPRRPPDMPSRTVSPAASDSAAATTAADATTRPWRSPQPARRAPAGSGGNGTPPPVEKVVRVVRGASKTPTASLVHPQPSASKSARLYPGYTPASRILHSSRNPVNARSLVQRPCAGDVWLNPRLFHAQHVYGLGIRETHTRVATPVLRRREHPGLQDDSLLHRNPTRVLAAAPFLFHHRSTRPNQQAAL